MSKLYDLTVLFVDQVVTAAIEGPVDSVTRLRAGKDVVGRLDASFFEESSVLTISLSYLL